MKLNISDETIFYVLAPANIDTGGPHDLHQLANELKFLGKKVYMYYYPEDQKNLVHENYKLYDLPHTLKIEDNKNKNTALSRLSSISFTYSDWHCTDIQSFNCFLFYIQYTVI